MPEILAVSLSKLLPNRAQTLKLRFSMLYVRLDGIIGTCQDRHLEDQAQALITKLRRRTARVGKQGVVEDVLSCNSQCNNINLI